MKTPLTFLGRFVLVSSLLFAAWSLLAEYYLAAVAPVVNLLYRLQHLPVQLDQRGGMLLLAYSTPGGGALRLQALDYHVVYLNLIAAVSMALALPGLRWCGRIRWTVALAGMLWATHVASFYAGAYIALWKYLAGLDGGPGASSLAAALGASFPASTARWLDRAVEVWNLWGRYGLVLVAAFGAQRAWVRPEEVPAAAPAAGRLPALWTRLKPVLHRPAAVPQELKLNPVT